MRYQEAAEVLGPVFSERLGWQVAAQARLRCAPQAPAVAVSGPAPAGSWGERWLSRQVAENAQRLAGGQG